MLFRSLIQTYARQSAQQALRNLGRSAEPRPEAPCLAVVACALNIEAGGLIDALQHRIETRCARFKQHDGFLGEQRIVVIETGEGVKAASEAISDAMDLHQPPWVVSAGFAAALCEGIRRGEMLMASELIDAYGNELSIPLGLDSRQLPKGVRVGRLLTLDHRLEDPAAKKAAGDQYGALAYDLESMAVALACRHRQTKFLAVRAVQETIADTVPPQLKALAEQSNWAARVGVVAGALWNRPSSAKLWWDIKASAVRASDQLAEFLGGVLVQLK